MNLSDRLLKEIGTPPPEYYCPDCLNMKTKKPGKCPKCGSELKKKKYTGIFGWNDAIRDLQGDKK